MVTRVPVDTSYEFPRSELTAMSDNIAWLIKDINKLDSHRRNMMEELKVLRGITMFYNTRHPELHRRTEPDNLEEDNDKNPPGQHREDLTERTETDNEVKININNT